MGHMEKNVRIGLLSLGLAALGWTFTDRIHGSAAAGQQAASSTDEARRTRFTAAAAALDDEG